MEQIVASWLTQTLPHESYPYVIWASAHFDIARPMMISGLVAYLAVIGLLGCGAIALLRRLR